MKEPRAKQGIVAVTVVLVVVVLASLANSSVWATPVQDALRQTIPTPAPPPTATPLPPPQSIVLPPQPGGEEYSFVYVPLPSVSYPPPVGCGIYSPFRVEAYLGTEPAYPVSFNPPLEICVSYTEDEAAEAGGAENLSVAYWDAELEQWIPLDNRRHDASLLQVCGDISFLSANNVFAITCVISPTAVPVTGHGLGSGSPYAVLALLATLAGIAIVGLRQHQRKNTR
jgi:hypothetical protein